jgi:antitoxin VapB
VKEGTIETAQLLEINNTQCVRLPEQYRFAESEVYIKKIHGIVLLIPKNYPWTSLVGSLDDFTEDFMDTRDQPENQSRSFT